MKPEMQYELDKARRQSMMRQAEMERMAKPSTQKPNVVLSAVGRQMVKLGERLQGQDEPVETYVSYAPSFEGR